MLEQRSDQLHSVISRPARGAAVALLVCVPVLLVSLVLPLGPTKIIIGFVGAFGVGFALLILAAQGIRRFLGKGQSPDGDEDGADESDSRLFEGHRAPDPVAAPEPTTAQAATPEPTQPAASDASSLEDTQPIALPVDLREGQSEAAAGQSASGLRLPAPGRVRLTE